MRKIAANYIFPVESAPIKNGHLVIDEEDRIIDVVDTKGIITEIEGLEYYSGVLVPGFVYIDESAELTKVQITILSNELEQLDTNQKKTCRYLWSRGIQALAQGEWLTNPNKYPSVIAEILKQIEDGKSDFELQLKKFTVENAQKLGIEKDIGSLCQHKKAGVLLLSGFNYKAFSITNKTKIKRLV